MTNIQNLYLGSFLDWDVFYGKKTKRKRTINIGVSHLCEFEPINPIVLKSLLVTEVGLS